MSEALSERNCGFYGKIPARGDFVGSGLLPDFVATWDAWLQDVLSAASETLAAEWPDRYLNAPIWRFALESGVCGETGVIGIVMVSVDAVGRFFPLTIAAVSFASPMVAFGLSIGQDWFKRIEAVALSALEEGASYQAFLDAMAEIAAPDLPTPRWALAPNRMAPVDDLTAMLLGLSGAGMGPQLALWWTEGAADFPSALLRSNGLPNMTQAVAFFDGRWTVRGWNAD